MLLEQKFGEKHYIYSAELLPLVLDTTHNSQESESLTTHILSTFNQDKSNLSTWVTVIFKSCSAVKQSLKEHGIVQLSDWTILRYTTHTRLKRVLSSLQLTSTEIIKYVKLFNAFHQVTEVQFDSFPSP